MLIVVIYPIRRSYASATGISRAGYNVELKEYIDGVERIANEARAAREVGEFYQKI